jgi:nitrous oxide reductase accessory protein NosL
VKKVLPILVSLVMVAIIAGIFVSMAKNDGPITIVTGNTAMKPLPIEIGKTNDTQCAMLLKSEENAAEVVAPDGRTWFFDDPGCMVLWLKDKPFKDQAKLWVHTIDTKAWLDARKAHYGVTDPSEMHYGFGARAKATPKSIDFEEMTLRMYRGENLTDPKIRKKLLGI